VTGRRGEHDAGDGSAGPGGLPVEQVEARWLSVPGTVKELVTLPPTAAARTPKATSTTTQILTTAFLRSKVHPASLYSTAAIGEP
jgi:hypothetical protein